VLRLRRCEGAAEHACAQSGKIGAACPADLLRQRRHQPAVGTGVARLVDELRRQQAACACGQA
jgi:hypothetical protein